MSFIKNIRNEKLKKILDVFARASNLSSNSRLPANAAACAFWLFLSLVPFVIVIAALVPYTPLTQEMLLDAITDYIPSTFQELLRGMVTDVFAGGAGVLSISLLLTFWTSGMGFSALIRGLEEIYGKSNRSGFVKLRIRALAEMFIFLVTLVVALVIMGLGSSLQSIAERHFPILHDFFAWLNTLRFGAVQVLLVLVFASIYRWAPGVRLRWVEQLPGAVFASLGWWLFSTVFSLWISTTGGYSTYGRLATVAVVMVWFYYCVTILLWGGCLNRAAAKWFSSRKERKK